MKKMDRGHGAEAAVVYGSDPCLRQPFWS